MKKKRVAILFFGLSRSLGKTIESIKKNLFTPLDNNSIDYDIFIHTNKISGAYHNRWSKEHTDNYNNENIIKILNPKYFIWDNQETIINNINFNEYYKKLGSWSHGFSPEMTKYLIKNMCLALYSKKQITMLFEKHKENYDYAIIIRPDLQLHNKININYFNELNDNNIILPKKDWWMGCNDRILIGKPNIILYCGKLFDELKIYSERKSIISERYLLDKLKEKKITIITKNINYSTIRI